MKNKFMGVFAFVAVVVIIGGSIFIMKLVKGGIEASQKARAGHHEVAVPVQVGKVGRAQIDNVLTFNGDVQAVQTVSLQPRVSGRLLNLAKEDGTPVEEGTLVKKGELIAVIDDRELQASAAAASALVESAEAELVNCQAGIMSAKANLAQKQAALEQARAATESSRTALQDKERELKRQSGLLEKKATSQQSFDLAQTAYDQALAALKQSEAGELAAQAMVESAKAGEQQAEAAIGRAKAGLLQAQASYQAALVNLSETKLYAPMDGVVSRRHVDPGSMVSPTTSIVTVLALDEVKILLAVPMNYLSKMVPGETVGKVKTMALPGEEFPCTLTKIYPAVETSTRTAQIEIRMANPRDARGDFKLRAGMYAAVDVLIESKPSVLAIDMAIPVRVQDRFVVYAVDGDGVKAVDVKLGTSFGKMVELQDGLAEGQEIVIVGQHRLTDGAKIKRVEGNNLSLSEE